ncbi:hypothetical protein GCM10020258_21470 [Sphingomonas yabuuchiae]
MTADGKSDWLAFQGASYFRTAGAQDQYGLSARGIAIDTGIDGREEFPAFTDFWIKRTGAQGYTVYALLDGPSVSGAYRIDRPRAQTASSSACPPSCSSAETWNGLASRPRPACSGMARAIAPPRATGGPRSMIRTGWRC